MAVVFNSYGKKNNLLIISRFTNQNGTDLHNFQKKKVKFDVFDVSQGF